MAAPNVLVTGTPGTGKTTTAQQIAEKSGLRYINVGDWVKEKELHSGWDEDFQCYTIDEDLVRAEPSPLAQDGSGTLTRSYGLPRQRCSIGRDLSK